MGLGSRVDPWADELDRLPRLPDVSAAALGREVSELLNGDAGSPDRGIALRDEVEQPDLCGKVDERLSDRGRAPVIDHRVGRDLSDLVPVRTERPSVPALLPFWEPEVWRRGPGHR